MPIAPTSQPSVALGRLDAAVPKMNALVDAAYTYDAPRRMHLQQMPAPELFAAVRIPLVEASGALATTAAKAAVDTVLAHLDEAQDGAIGRIITAAHALDGAVLATRQLLDATPAAATPTA